MNDFTIRSYSHNGTNWEWDSCEWPFRAASADEALDRSTAGDFSRYGNGEECRLAAFDAHNDGPSAAPISVLVFVPKQ